MNDIVMPKLSDTMTEGRLVSWNKRVGDTVARGEVIAEVETDKANMELEAYVSGELLEIRVQAGDVVPVGTVIAVIGNAGEKGAGAEKQSAPVPHLEPEPARAQVEPPSGPPAAPQSEPAAGEGGAAAAEPQATKGGKPAEAVDLAPPEGEKQAPAAPPRTGAEETQPAGEPKEPYRPEAPPAGAPPAASPKGPEPAAGAAREKAAPVVRRRARELGIELAQVRGSGPEGRILLTDLETQAKGAGEAPGVSQPPAGQGVPGTAEAGPAPQGEGPRPFSRLRSAVAKTVIESWSHIPHFTVTLDIGMDEAEAVRRQLKQSGMQVSVNDLIVKAVALALEKFPQMNASFTPDGLQFHNDINIAIAVGMPDGVLMPVLAGCQRLSLLEIAQQGRRLVERARSGSLGEQEMHGGTFSISNLGMFGVSSFSAIIHPAHSGVLAVGAVAEVAKVSAGVLSSIKVMKVTLSADHRVVDGAYAAQFLAALKEILENPVRLLI
jgi:pyruvate dehydrogenase E2 component (dihydrolipoamide acetyltransferase)